MKLFILEIGNNDYPEYREIRNEYFDNYVDAYNWAINAIHFEKIGKRVVSSPDRCTYRIYYVNLQKHAKYIISDYMYDINSDSFKWFHGIENNYELQNTYEHCLDFSLRYYPNILTQKSSLSEIYKAIEIRNTERIDEINGYREFCQYTKQKEIDRLHNMLDCHLNHGYIDNAAFILIQLKELM